MIPLVRPIVGEREKAALAAVVDSRMLASGTVVEEFEGAFARYCGTAHAVAVSNGTTALHAALLAAGVRPGDRVLTTAFSFIATANSILHCGAVPVFADIDPVTFNLSLDSCRAAFRADPAIRAVLAVHLYGQPAPLDGIIATAREHGAVVVEDCAQAHGARIGARRVGSIGMCSAFSFYATKNMMTGEGGMVVTGDADIAARARQIINHGRSGHSLHTMAGYNYRMTNLAAAIGCVQLEQLDAWNDARRANAAYYSARLVSCAAKPPSVTPGTEHVFHQYTVRVPVADRERFMKHLAQAGVGCGVYYPTAMYEQPVYQDRGYRQGLCPQAELAAREVVSIPVHPGLSSEERDTVARAVAAFV